LSELSGATLEVVRLEGRTPLIYIEVPGQGDETVMLYGHLDKQPEMTGWAQGLGPWTPVIRGDKLYGRGGADDGYAIFGSLAALLALHEQGIPHARCVVMIEACEESGSYDLPYYVDHLAARIGSPSLRQELNQSVDAPAWILLAQPIVAPARGMIGVRGNPRDNLHS
jgi:acetylornithine deacetylase/succinyl-diaminopimelate desuccinylase-like protein